MSWPPAPEIVSLSDVMARISSITPSIESSIPPRLLFAPPSATRNRSDFVLGSQALYDADVAVALARHRLDEQLAAQQLQLALLRRFQTILANDLAGFDTLTRGLTAAQDSLTRVYALVSAAGTRLTGLFMGQITATRLLAALAADRDLHLWVTHPSPALWHSVSQHLAQHGVEAVDVEEGQHAEDDVVAVHHRRLDGRDLLDERQPDRCGSGHGGVRKVHQPALAECDQHQQQTQPQRRTRRDQHVQRRDGIAAHQARREQVLTQTRT